MKKIIICGTSSQFNIICRNLKTIWDFQELFYVTWLMHHVFFFLNHTFAHAVIIKILYLCSIFISHRVIKSVMQKMSNRTNSNSHAITAPFIWKWLLLFSLQNNNVNGNSFYCCVSSGDHKILRYMITDTMLEKRN